jgi:hypothetical protein
LEETSLVEPPQLPMLNLLHGPTQSCESTTLECGIKEETVELLKQEPQPPQLKQPLQLLLDRQLIRTTDLLQLLVLPAITNPTTPQCTLVPSTTKEDKFSAKLDSLHAAMLATNLPNTVAGMVDSLERLSAPQSLRLLPPPLHLLLLQPLPLALVLLRLQRPRAHKVEDQETLAMAKRLILRCTRALLMTKAEMFCAQLVHHLVEIHAIPLHSTVVETVA